MKPPRREGRKYMTAIAGTDLFNSVLTGIATRTTGHILIETHDGDLTSVYHSPDPKPTKTSDYEELY